MQLTLTQNYDIVICSDKPFTQPAGCGVRNDKDNFKRELASLIGERYPDLSKRIVGGGESDVSKYLRDH